MLGRKLTQRLVRDRDLRGASIDHIDLTDLTEPVDLSPACTAVAGDLADPAVAEHLASRRPDVVFHLAGVVSGEAGADFDKGTRVNLEGTRALFDALRQARPGARVVFTSSIAVFGAPFPDPIGDDYHRTPHTSYGTQKLIGEALLADYTRRGFIDGVGIRLPTITVRPGRPNAAASGFFSSIIREPLAGKRAALPVGIDVRHPHASPRSAIGFLVHAAELPSTRLGAVPNITMPSVSVTVGDQIESLRRIAGQAAVDLIETVEDEAVATIVAGWPRRFETPRAKALGFVCDADFDEIIQTYLADDVDAQTVDDAAVEDNAL